MDPDGDIYFFANFERRNEGGNKMQIVKAQYEGGCVLRRDRPASKR